MPNIWSCISPVSPDVMSVFDTTFNRQFTVTRDLFELYIEYDTYLREGTIIEGYVPPMGYDEFSMVWNTEPLVTEKMAYVDDKGNVICPQGGRVTKDMVLPPRAAAATAKRSRDDSADLLSLLSDPKRQRTVFQQSL